MQKWIKISATLLPIMYIGCTEPSSSSFTLPDEEVRIQFTARPAVNYDIDVSTRAGSNEYNLGIVGIAATENDSASDCLDGLCYYDFCRTLNNAEFIGQLPGVISPIDGNPRTFPFEKRSAMAVYGYLPYRNSDIHIGDTSCYLNLDLASEKFSVDYMYTGKVFRDKASYTEESSFDLQFKHAFAKVKFNFSSSIIKDFGGRIHIDTLAFCFKSNGKGLFDLKNGNFYPEVSKKPSNNRLNFTEIVKVVNSGNSTSAIAEAYIPPSMKLKSIRLVISDIQIKRPFAVEVPFDGDVILERGYEYSISFKYKEHSKVTIRRE